MNSLYDFKIAQRFSIPEVKVPETVLHLNPQIKAIKQMNHKESQSARNNESSSMSSLIKQSTSSQYDLQMFSK